MDARYTRLPSRAPFGSPGALPAGVLSEPTVLADRVDKRTRGRFELALHFIERRGYQVDDLPFLQWLLVGQDKAPDAVFHDGLALAGTGAYLRVVGDDEPTFVAGHRQPLGVADILGELIFEPENVFSHLLDRVRHAPRDRAVDKDHATSGIS